MIDLTISEANIANLTSLWKTVSLPFGGYKANADFEYCAVQNSEWPNKMWATKNITEPVLDEMIETLRGVTAVLTVPVWSIYGESTHQLLEEKGFKLRQEQTGMSIDLSTSFQFENRLVPSRVDDELESQVWEAVYPLSFGYKISKEVVLQTCREVDYYLFYLDNRAVGTAILYRTDEVIGIHGVGVVPEARRKGLANDMLCFLLNRSLELGVNRVVLQASAMGKGLYDKLGFQEDFRMRNYVLQPNL